MIKSGANKDPRPRFKFELIPIIIVIMTIRLIVSFHLSLTAHLIDYTCKVTSSLEYFSLILKILQYIKSTRFSPNVPFHDNAF